MRLTDHFELVELVPEGTDLAKVPLAIIGNLESLCRTLLEPVREAMGSPLHINDAWRPPAKNTAVGGVSSSDHLTGNAADFYVYPLRDMTWQDLTISAAHWLRRHGEMPFGQLILEDHRESAGTPSSLWIHLAGPSEKHPAVDHPNRYLKSPEKGIYLPWTVATETSAPT